MFVFVRAILEWTELVSVLAMFGVKVSSKGGPEPESRADFVYVEGVRWAARH